MKPPAPIRFAGIAAATVLALLAVGAILVPRLAASRVRAAARARGLEATWSRLDVSFPARAHIEALLVRRIASGETLLVAERADVALRALPLLAGRARIADASIAGVRIALPAPSAALADTLVPDAEASTPAVAPAVRAKADALVRALLAPARSAPALHVRDLEVARGGERRLTLGALDLTHDRGAETIAAQGALHGETDTPFDVLVRWQRDDRLTARAEFRLGAAEPPSPAALVVQLAGRVTQDHRARELRIAEGTRLTVGELAAAITGVVAERGPRFQLAIAADGLTAGAILRSVPASVLGPLAGLALTGSFDWHGGVDLDLARPDDVSFRADVIPHGLALDPALSRPSLAALAGPFVAHVHLPHDRIVDRAMSDANPHFRTLDRISPFLRDAVVTNEDGGFWKHRGFNTEAIGSALADNLRAGRYKRGAGTITMQLARNLWLGHRRTLSRKAQEVALTWLLEHQGGVAKERLLEIYLNAIEWGPDVFGADEAAQYYFAEDASQLSLAEALFLTIVVPSPTKWKWRFAPDGTLRPFARAQMRFIAGKMASKGWLDPARVPPADSLHVTLRGPARALFAAPDSAVGAPADTAAAIAT